MNSLEKQAQIATHQGEHIIHRLQNLLSGWGVPESIIIYTRVAISIVIILLVAYFAKKLTDFIVLRVIHKIASHTKSLWDDFLVERHVFRRLSNLIPALIAYHLTEIALADFSHTYYEVIQMLIRGYSVFVVVWTLDALLNAGNDMYNTSDMAKDRSIKGYIQVGKIIIYFFGTIVIIGILADKDPTKILFGLGTFAAVLMLVFKDTILGLVASVQLSANDLVKIGDWIEMPNRNIDGKVMDISLTSVKVQNWDFTINSIPTYSLVTESFQNWRGMELAQGRRLKNSIYIDVNSVRLCSDELLDRLDKFPVLHDYLMAIKADLKKETAASNGEHGIAMGVRPSNLNLFRNYVELSLRSNADIHQELSLLVRYLPAIDKGVPVEYICFSRKKDSNEFENVKAGLLEHFWSVLPEFNLTPFQNPTGADFRMMAERQ
jgi:miniconductance mechanosensitive channel